MKLRNGEVWVSPTYIQAITQWLDQDQWILLSAPSKAAHGGSCMVAMSDPETPHQLLYTHDELCRRLADNGWKLTRKFAACDGWPVCRTDAENAEGAAP